METIEFSQIQTNMLICKYAVEEKIIIEAMVDGIRSAVQKFVSQDLVLLESISEMHSTVSIEQQC